MHNTQFDSGCPQGAKFLNNYCKSIYEIMETMASALHGVWARLSVHSSNPKINHVMSKILSIALFVAGVVLLVYGLNASGSFSSSVSRAVNGAPNDKTIWLIALGVIGLIAGGFGLFRRGQP
jgi:hypothetical protein